MWAIIRPHYKQIVKRGLIDITTTNFEFHDKAKEELQEAYRECFQIHDRLGYEITDLIYVCFNWFYHKRYDINLFIKNTKLQEKRANETKQLK